VNQTVPLELTSRRPEPSRFSRKGWIGTRQQTAQCRWCKKHNREEGITALYKGEYYSGICNAQNRKINERVCNGYEDPPTTTSPMQPCVCDCVIAAKCTLDSRAKLEITALKEAKGLKKREWTQETSTLNIAGAGRDVVSSGMRVWRGSYF
jgi:hypothetical protein